MSPEAYFEADTLDDLMQEVFVHLLERTEIVSASRGDFTEIFGAMLVLNNPRARLSRSESRGKIFSALGELFWYLSKTNSHQFIEYYLPDMYKKEDEEDDNSVRNGYGKRLFNHSDRYDQIRNVTDTLRVRKTSRKAVIQLFDASDLSQNFHEVPCTCTLQFLIRNGKLDLLVNMRSNDAYRGLPHDIFSFTMLQELIARSLDVEVGTYKHCAGSLHLYKKFNDENDDGRNDHEEAKRFINEGWQQPISMPPMPSGDQWNAVEFVQELEEKIRTGQKIDIASSGLDPYWQDICRLLQVLRLGKSASNELHIASAACKLVHQQMSNKIYDMFVIPKIESLESRIRNDK